jgi:hypothetical protein
LTSILPQASTILASLGQAAFVWDIATDAIAWSDHAASVFTDIPAAALASGAEFSKLIEPVRSIRSDALGHSPPARGSDGASYRIEYGVRMSTSEPLLWIEETGRWFAGVDGRPARVQGIVRVNNERHARDEQLLKLSRYSAPLLCTSTSMRRPTIWTSNRLLRASRAEQRQSFPCICTVSRQTWHRC